MKAVADLLLPEAIRLELREKRKKRVLAELTELAAKAWNIEAGEELTRNILEREELNSTAIGHGIALPHCLSPLAPRTAMAFGRSKTGISYGTPDNRPVFLLFLLIGPTSATAEHLKLLSKLSRLLTEKEFREHLLHAGEAQEIIDLFRRQEEM